MANIRNKLRNIKYALSSYKAPHPVSLQIEITNFCNLRCRTCGRDDLKLKLHSVVYKGNKTSFQKNISSLLETISVDEIIYAKMKTHNYRDARSEMRIFFDSDEKEYLISEGNKKNTRVIFNENLPLKNCSRPFGQLYVLFDGNVTPCCNIVDDKYYSFGTLLDVSRLDNIWNSVNACLFRKCFNRKNAHHLC